MSVQHPTLNVAWMIITEVKKSLQEQEYRGNWFIQKPSNYCQWPDEESWKLRRRKAVNTLSR